MATLRQTPLSCSGHTRPVVHLDFSGVTPHGYFMISACKGRLACEEYQISMCGFDLFLQRFRPKICGDHEKMQNSAPCKLKP